MALKDKKHWSTQSEAARDEVRDAVEEAVDFVLRHRREAAWAAGGAIALGVLAGLFLYGRRTRENAAWDKLSQAELLAYSGRPQDAETLISQVAEESGSPAVAGLARLLEGDLRFPKGDYEQALAAYQKAADAAPQPLKPYAEADRVLTLEAAGKNAECAAAAQVFVGTHAEHLLAAQVLASQARCQLAAGQADAARATLQRLSAQYSNTPWGEWAAARAASLPAAPAVPAK